MQLYTTAKCKENFPSPLELYNDLVGIAPALQDKLRIADAPNSCLEYELHCPPVVSTDLMAALASVGIPYAARRSAASRHQAKRSIFIKASPNAF